RSISLVSSQPIGADESAVNAALVITLMLRVRHRYSRQFAGMLAPWLWKDRREETHLIHVHNTGVCSYTCICKKQANRENTLCTYLCKLGTYLCKLGTYLCKLAMLYTVAVNKCRSTRTLGNNESGLSMIVTTKGAEYILCWRRKMQRKKIFLFF